MLTASGTSATLRDARDGRALASFPHEGKVTEVGFSPEGEFLYTVAGEGDGPPVVNVWRPDGRHVGRLPAGERRRVALGPRGRLVAEAAAETVRVWDAEKGVPLATLPGHTRPVTDIRFSSDGRRILTASRDTTARVWDVKSGRELHAIQGQRIRPTAKPETPDAAFSPDGRLLAVATSGRVEIWDTQTWQNLRNLLPDGPKASRLAVAFSPDGSSVAVAAGLRVEVWSVGGERLAELTPGDGKEAVNDVDFSRDGRLIAAAGTGLVQVWSTKDWKTASVISEGTTPVFHLAFAPGDSSLMTENGDGLVHLYPPEMFLPYEELLDFIPRRVSRRQLSEAERRRYLPAP